MGISDRIEGTIEKWRIKWGDTLKGWMASWVMKGVETTFDFFEPDLRAEIKPSLQRLREIPGLPEDIKAILDKAMTEPKAIQFVVLLPYLIAVMVGFAMGSMQPAMRMGGYGLDLVMRSARLDPASVITAWRRDKGKYEKYFEDLKSQGWSDDRIEALKFVTQFYPSPQDLVGFLAHEVYEDTIAAKYGLDAEIGEVLKHLDKFEKAGMQEPQVREFWRDHWQHASWMQVVEMLHRGLLTEGDVTSPTTKGGWEARDAEGTKLAYDWFRLVEIPPFWRDKLTASSWNVPTRVDVRRWWDMRTISEDELRNIYHRQGYHGSDLENYVKWTKVYTDFPMMMSRFTNGWIKEQDIRDWLKGLEIPEDRIQQFIEEKTKPEKGARVAAEKDLTVTDIIMGVKKGIISREEGVELIEDLGYDREEAEFKVDVRVSAAAGSPETFEEFRDLTQKWRAAVGMPSKPVTEELKAAAAEVVRLTREVASLKEAIKAEEATLIDIEPLPEAATKKRDELRVALHRAEAELNRVKTEYDSLVAQWRYGE